MAKAAKKAAPKKEAAKAAPKKAVSKSTTSKAADKGTAAKKAAPKKAPRKANAAFAAPLNVSPALQAVVGNKPMPRTEIVKKMWDYIKANNLQDQKNKRMINADDKLKPLFGKGQVSMFELAKVINNQVEK